MEKNQAKDLNKGPEDVIFWGGVNDDKQDHSMDWSHDGHFWIPLSADKVAEIVNLVRQFLSEKIGGDWPERPSLHAVGRYVEVKHDHHLFAEYSRKEPKDRYAEVHLTDTARAIFVRFWHGLTDDAKAFFQAQGFKFQPEIPNQYRVKVPGTEISPEKAKTLEKFRKSEPLTVPEGKLERTRGGGASWVGIAVVVGIIVIALFLLRGQIKEMFVKPEPLLLGSFKLASGQMAVFEQPDGEVVYALADTTIDGMISDKTVFYGALIDTTRTGFYAISKFTDAMGKTLHEAMEGATFVIPTYLEDEALSKYIAVDTESFQHDKKKDWENLQGKQVSISGYLIRAADGFYLEAGDGSIKLDTEDPFTLLNLQLAQKHRASVTIYGTVGETFDWKTVRKETQKMFHLSVDPLSYATMAVF